MSQSNPAAATGAATSSSVPTTTRRRFRWLAYAPAPLLVAALLLTYLVSPRFYLDYILEESRREYQAVEITTFVCALMGSVLMFLAAARLWRGAARLERRDWRGAGGAAGIVALIGLAAFFFAGEEISWGQTWLGWETPERYAELSVETNLHNTDIPVQSLGSLFLIIMFFVLPAAFALRKQTGLPQGWAPAIAGGPTIFFMAVAFVWKEFKSIYRAVQPGGELDSDPFYMGFVEQLNEQKEMLVGVALLLYGCGRLRAAIRARPQILLDKTGGNRR